MTALKTKHLVWCAALVLILACVPALPGPAVEVPTIDPNMVGTMIMQTAAAAATETVAAMPSATPTASFTPTRNTDTPEPTATNTVVFILFSPTARVSTASGSGSGVSGGSSSDAYACKVTSASPANGTSFKPRTEFDARWTITNIGKNKWEANSVDYIYLSGDKIHKVEAYDLPAAVEPGGSISIIVDMIAPKDPGSYSTAWSLRVDTNKFCPLLLTIAVNN